MACKIKKGEWILLYIVTGVIDVIQYILDFIVGPGEAINMVADAVIGVLLLGYFQFRGAAMFKHLGRAGSMVGMTALGELTAGVASFWILEVWYMQKSIKKEQALEQDAQGQEEMFANNVRQPAYVNGARQPRTGNSNQPEQTGQRTRNNMPLSSKTYANSGGVRAPSMSFQKPSNTGTSGNGLGSGTQISADEARGFSSVKPSQILNGGLMDGKEARRRKTIDEMRKNMGSRNIKDIPITEEDLDLNMSTNWADRDAYEQKVDDYVDTENQRIDQEKLKRNTKLSNIINSTR